MWAGSDSPVWQSVPGTRWRNAMGSEENFGTKLICSRDICVLKLNGIMHIHILAFVSIDVFYVRNM